MKNKIIQFIPVLVALLAICFPYFSNWCIGSFPSCYSSWVHYIYQYFTSPLYFFSLYSLPFAIILIFLTRRVFVSWLKFAAWALPLLFLFIASQPVNATHVLSTNRDDAANLAGQIFAGVSFILIIWKWIVACRIKQA